MPRTRAHETPPELLDNLIDTARAAFARDGFEGASLNHILDEAGVSKGAFYYHYDGKDDLFQATVMATVEPLFVQAGLPPVVGSADEFWSNLAAYFARLYALFRGDATTMGLMRAAGQAMSNPAMAAAYGEMQAKSMGVVLDVIRNGQSVGAVRVDLPAEVLAGLTFAVDQVLDAHILSTWDDLSEADRQRWLDVGIDLMRRIAEPREVVA